MFHDGWQIKHKQCW